MSETHSKWWAWAMVFVGSFGGAACSSSDSSAGARQVVTTHVVAATGGTVTAPGGAATLTIPAGALAADTDISVEVLAATAGSLSPVYDFGPDGTTFAVPANLALAADESLAPSGKRLVVGMLADGAWVALAGSTYGSGLASAPVPHFTGFGVIGADLATASDAGADGETDAGADAPDDSSAASDAADACVSCLAGLCPAETAACVAEPLCGARIAMIGQCVSFMTSNGDTFTAAVNACAPDFATPICFQTDAAVCTGDALDACLLALGDGAQASCLSTCVWN